MATPGIRFNDYLFTEPVRFDAWMPPKYAGLFVVLMKDPNWAPRPFQALYFGEFGNNAQEALHTLYRAGMSGAHRPPAFWISVLALPFSTTAQRADICKQLVWAYNPIWQSKDCLTGSSEIARKLEDLEKKHEEQTTQFRLLLANFNRLFEPQPEPPRRPIGFLPRPDTAG